MNILAVFLVFAVGGAINAHNGDYKTEKEIVEAAKVAVERDFSRDEFVSFKLND